MSRENLSQCRASNVSNNAYNYGKAIRRESLNVARATLVIMNFVIRSHLWQKVSMSREQR